MATAYESITIKGGDTATPLNLQKRLSYIWQHIPNASVRFLDCGCGRGEYVAVLVRQFQFNAYGIEYMPEKLVEVQASLVHEGRIIRGNIEQIPFGNAWFDSVLLNEVMEHIPHPQLALAEIYRVLKPGGKLIVFSPNRWYPFETHGVLLKNGGARVPHWTPLIPYIPLSVGSHFLEYPARNYWPAELEAQLIAAGFAVIDHSWIWQTFENISGAQPRLIRWGRPVLRWIAAEAERLPGIRRLGASQVIVARKPVT
jgi:SAM-dependent methyltransferase